MTRLLLLLVVACLSGFGVCQDDRIWNPANWRVERISESGSGSQIMYYMDNGQLRKSTTAVSTAHGSIGFNSVTVPVKAYVKAQGSASFRITWVGEGPPPANLAIRKRAVSFAGSGTGSFSPGLPVIDDSTTQEGREVLGQEVLLLPFATTGVTVSIIGSVEMTYDYKPSSPVSVLQGYDCYWNAIVDIPTKEVTLDFQHSQSFVKRMVGDVPQRRQIQNQDLGHKIYHTAFTEERGITTLGRFPWVITGVRGQLYAAFTATLLGPHWAYFANQVSATWNPWNLDFFQGQPYFVDRQAVADGYAITWDSLWDLCRTDSHKVFPVSIVAEDFVGPAPGKRTAKAVLYVHPPAGRWKTLTAETPITEFEEVRGPGGLLMRETLAKIGDTDTITFSWSTTRELSFSVTRSGGVELSAGLADFLNAGLSTEIGYSVGQAWSATVTREYSYPIGPATQPGETWGVRCRIKGNERTNFYSIYGLDGYRGEMTERFHVPGEAWPDCEKFKVGE